MVERIRRVHTKINTERDITQTKYAWNIIEYSHTEYLSDSLRVQTRGNFMTDHNVLSPEGEALRGMLDRTH